MSRDFGIPVVLGLLALAVLPVSGLASGLGVPATMPGFLSLVLAVTAFGALVVFPWIGPHGVRGIGRVGAMAVVSVPFVVFALLETPRLPGVTLLPAPAWWLALAGGVTLAALTPSRAVPLGVLLFALLGLDAVLGAADRPLMPRAWGAAGGPVIEVGAEPDDEAASTDAILGWRPGDAVVVDTTPLGAGTGPWYAAAERGRFPPSAALVAVFGEPLPSGDVAGGLEILPARALDPDRALAWDAFRAVVLLPGTWPAVLGEPAGWADALATYARRGGLLIGPAPDRPWPTAIGRRLGRAGSARGGDGEDVRTYGLGTVARARSAARMRELIDAASGGARLSTVFDEGAGPLPSGNMLLMDGAAQGPSRRAQGLLLVFYALVAALLDRVLRRGWPRLLGALGPALAVVAGLVWSSPVAPGVETRGLAFDLGGGGGRRVEAVLLAAGDGGWMGRVTWQGGGLVRLAGGRVDAEGRVRLGPGERAWTIRETVAQGGFEAERESPREGYLLRFVRGEVDPANVRLGRVDRLPLRIEGTRPTSAATLTIP